MRRSTTVSSRRRTSVSAIALGVALAGCDLPADPGGTTARVENGVLRVGVSDSPPWVRLRSGGIGGVEPALVREFAQRMQARIQFVPGGESELLAGLKAGELDLVVGGITAAAPASTEFSTTQPYVVTTTRIAVPAGTQPPQQLRGLKVAMRAGDPAGLTLRSKGAVVVPVDDVRRRAADAYAIEDWRARALGLTPAGAALRRAEHVMLAMPGENRWVLTLDRFLAERKTEIRSRLEAEART